MQGTGKAFGTHKNLKFVAAEGHNPQMLDEEGQLKRRREEYTRIAAAATHKQRERRREREGGTHTHVPHGVYLTRHLPLLAFKSPFCCHKLNIIKM